MRDAGGLPTRDGGTIQPRRLLRSDNLQDLSPDDVRHLVAGETATFNIPAVFIALVMTGVLILGIKLSSRVTSIIVAIKIAIVLLVIVVGIFYVKAANYQPFIPPAKPSPAGSGRGLNLPIPAVIRTAPAVIS